MSNKFNLPAVYAAMVRKVQDIISATTNAGISADLQYMAWDSRGDITELPNTDLIGVADWTYDETDLHLPEIEFAILLSVHKDTNLFREAEILEQIRKVCVHSTKPEYLVWTMYDEENNPFAQLQVTDFSVMPSGESEARSVRQVGISLKRADYES